MIPIHELHKTRELIHSGVLEAHPEFMDEYDGILRAVCNGCGAAGAKFDFVPDTLWGMCICSCCHIHDYGYFRGETDRDRDREDLRFLMNMLKLIERNSANGFMRWIRKRRAMTYYNAVCEFGEDAFWENKITDDHYNVAGVGV